MRAVLFLAVLFFCFSGNGALAAQGALAQEARQAPETAQQIHLSYAPVVKKAAPAVVNIYTKTVVRQRVISPFMDDPLFQHFFGGGLLPEGMTRQRLENALGSGVIVGAEGLIVTSHHVIKGADEITVVLADRREFEAKLVTSDPRADLAFLRIETKGERLPFLPLRDSDEVEVGDLVLAIGNPFGVGQTVTTGIVSAAARTSTDINDLNYFIQTDAAINPGNSGGALVTMDGHLLGINTAIYSRSGGSMGIGFAVPSNMVRAMMGAAASGQKNVVRAWTGIEGQDVTADIAASLHLSPPSGFLIKALHTASPARAAGLKVGDVVLSVNGKDVADLAAFRYRIATLPLGGEAGLGVFRQGARQSVRLPLMAPPEVPLRQETLLKGRHPLAGATVAHISPALLEEKNWDMLPESGVVVVKVAPNSFAASMGLRVGDVVLGVNDTEIQTVDDLQKYMGVSAARWRIFLNRGGQTLRMFVGG